MKKKKLSLSIIKKKLFNYKSINLLHKYLSSINLEESDYSNGVSTACIKMHDNTVLCYTLDFLKISYLKKSKAPGFKFLQFIEYDKEVIFMYQMNHLERISEELFDNNEEFEQFESLDDFNLNTDSDEYQFIYSNYVNSVAINKTCSKYSKYVEIYSDLSMSQFGFDLKTMKIYCFDPFLTSNIDC